MVETKIVPVTINAIMWSTNVPTNVQTSLSPAKRGNGKRKGIRVRSTFYIQNCGLRSSP